VERGVKAGREQSGFERKLREQSKDFFNHEWTRITPLPLRTEG